EGQQLLQRAAEELASDLTATQAGTLADAAAALADTSRPALARLAAGTSQEVQQVLAQVPLREFVSTSATYPLRVHRPRALYGSWYEMFPRSEGAHQDEPGGAWVSGTLRTAAQRLPAIAELGFDV